MSEITLPYPILQGTNNRTKRLDKNYYAKLWDFEICIERGFITDGASIPRLFWSLIGSPFTGTHSRGALIHDALYAAEYFTRQHNDWLFLELLDYCGAWWWKRNLMWSAVKAGGYFVYKKHTAETIKDARKYITIKKF